MRTEEREIELIDYIEILLKRKWLILLGTLACVAGAVVYLLATASPVPLYTASAQIFVVSGQNQGKEVADTQTEIPSLTLDLYQAVAVSDDLVLAMNKLQQAWIDSLDLRVPERLALEAKTEGTTRLVMRVSATDTLLARLVLYAWVDTFMARTQQLNATESERYYAYVIAQYDTIRKYLEHTENDLMKFHLEYPITSLQNQQQIYLDQLESTQGSLIQLQLRLEQQTAQLSRDKELVQMLEFDGEPLYTLPTTGLPALREQFPSGLAAQMIDNILELDRLKDKRTKAEEHYTLLLLSFDQEHDYSRLQRTIAELAKNIENYQRSYLDARSKEFTSSINLQALGEELKKHPIALSTSNRPGETSPPMGLTAAGELNPAYVGLEKKRAEEGLNYETARLYSNQGEPQLKDLEARQEEAQRQLTSMQAERQKLMDEAQTVEGGLRGRIEAAQAAIDAIVKVYLASKKSIGDLEVQVMSLNGRLADQQAQLTHLTESAGSVQEMLAKASRDSVQLGRDKETYTATFGRFAKLSEEVRIAQQKTNTNLRVLTRDVTAKPVSVEEASRKKVWISGAVGLLLSTFLAFLLEYMHKARAQRAEVS